MEALRGVRAQEQAANLSPLAPGCGTPRGHEAAESHRGAAAVIAGVDLEGEAFLAGLQPGDLVLAVNGEPVLDVLDFSFRTAGEPAVLTLDRSGEAFEVELPGMGPAGIHFEQELFDGVRRCENSCVFCFVHQLPKQGLRRSLMVKDEDYRLSFLHGGYVTLGNFSEEDWRSILDMRLSPLYVSIHSTDTEVRNRMLGNPAAPDVMDSLRRLEAAGIEFHGQIVLVPGYNTGAELQRSLSDLAGLSNMRGTAIVPVGLTDHRERLPDLRALTQDECREALAAIAVVRNRTASPPRFFAGDELFLQAGLGVPDASYYGDEYPLYEDGVGMVRRFTDRAGELEDADRAPAVRPGRVALVTGTAATPILEATALPQLRRIEGLEVELVTVENDFFGRGITVAGLLTARDIIAALEPRGAFDRVLVGEHAFQPGGDVMLDGPTLGELAASLDAEVIRVPDDPAALLAAARGAPLPEVG